VGQTGIELIGLGIRRVGHLFSWVHHRNQLKHGGALTELKRTTCRIRSKHPETLYLCLVTTKGSVSPPAPGSPLSIAHFHRDTSHAPSCSAALGSQEVVTRV